MLKRNGCIKPKMLKAISFGREHPNTIRLEYFSMSLRFGDEVRRDTTAIHIVNWIKVSVGDDRPVKENIQMQWP